MRHTGVVTHTAAGVLLASVPLAGCGGGSDPDSSSKKADSPTKAEWTAAYVTYTEVGDAFNAAIGGATEYQDAVRKVHDASPPAVVSDPSVAAALADQQELAATRDEHIAALGDEPAISDPELEEAYDAFATAAPCKELLSGLDDSANYRIREYAANWRKVIDQRNDLMADVENTKAGFDQTIARLKRINGAFTKRNAQLTQFSDELAKVSAVEEYQALDAIFVENGAKPESPSTSPSPSPSSS